MRFWIDDNLPSGLAIGLSSVLGSSGETLLSIDLNAQDDVTIFEAARQPDVVIVSKDVDFRDPVCARGAPPQLLLVTCGNVTNKFLRLLFSNQFPATLIRLQTGEPIVEIGEGKHDQ
jgi:predicted nuclease of predicted toxin-antitoxin system